MGRNRPERQSGRVLAVKLGIVLVGLVILLALGYAGGRYLEKRRYTETRGELKDGFGEVPTVEIDGVTYEQIDAFLHGEPVSEEAFEIIKGTYEKTRHKREMPFAP